MRYETCCSILRVSVCHSRTVDAPRETLVLKMVHTIDFTIILGLKDETVNDAEMTHFYILVTYGKLQIQIICAKGPTYISIAQQM